MTVHELKTWPEFFEPVLTLRKTFELRLNDRGYQVDDTLHLCEWNPAARAYTGRQILKRVTYVLEGSPWLSEGYVCMGLGHA